VVVLEEGARLGGASLFVSGLETTLGLFFSSLTFTSAMMKGNAAQIGERAERGYPEYSLRRHSCSTQDNRCMALT
jgi:hypothetical protein